MDETAALKISAKACDTVAQYDTLLFGLCVVGEYFASGVILGEMCLVRTRAS